MKDKILRFATAPTPRQGLAVTALTAAATYGAFVYAVKKFDKAWIKADGGEPFN